MVCCFTLKLYGKRSLDALGIEVLVLETSKLMDLGRLVKINDLVVSLGIFNNCGLVLFDESIGYYTLDKKLSLGELPYIVKIKAKLAYIASVEIARIK